MSTFIFLGMVTMAQAQFDLAPKSRVVFLGDSNTQNGQYIRYLERFFRLAHPGREFSFFNAGVGGDKAWDGLARLESEVLSLNPTHVVVLFGVNDLGWGVANTEENRIRHRDSIRKIVGRLKGIPTYVASYPTVGTADGELNEQLDSLWQLTKPVVKELGAIPLELGQLTREAHRSLEAQAKPLVTLHEPDQIHFNQHGHYLIAHSLLKLWGVQATKVSYDVARGKVEGGEVIWGSTTPNKVHRFELKPHTTPYALVTFDRLGLSVTGLPWEMAEVRIQAPGCYEIKINGRIATETALDLSQGPNLLHSSEGPWVPTTPWSIQNQVVDQFTLGLYHLELGSRIASSTLPQMGTDSYWEGRRALESRMQEAARPMVYAFELTPAKCPKTEAP